MDSDLDPLIFQCWSEFYLPINNNVYTALQLKTSRIHTRDQNLSPSKVVTLLYVDTCLWRGTSSTYLDFTEM